MTESVRDYGPIALVLLLGLVLRVWGLQAQSLTMDELAELRIAKLSIQEIIWRTDGFPPLFNTLLHGWLQLFGSDQSARWLAVLLGCLAVLGIWQLGRQVGGPRAGQWAALLLAVSPFHIWFSQEARAYILYFLLAVLALWLFFRALATNRSADWVLYGLASLAGVYTHYYFFLLLAINALIFLVERRRLTERGPILVHAGLAVLSVPLIWLFQVDFAFEGRVVYPNPFRLASLGYTYFSMLAGFSVGPSIRDLHTLRSAQAVIQVLPWALVLGSVVAVLGYEGFKALGRPMWVRLAMLALIPVLAALFVARFMGVTFQVRHVAWAAVPLLVWLGAGISHGFRRWPVALATVALATVSAIAVRNRHSEARYANEDVRGLGAYLKAASAPDTPVFVITGYMAKPVSYYLGDSWIVYELPRVGVRGEGLGEALEFINSRVPVGSAFWLVYSRTFHGDPQGLLRDALLQPGVIQQRAEFPGVVLFRGRRG